MVGDAGTIPQMINGCRMCEREDGVVRCTLGQTAVEIDVTDCPGEAVIAGPETLVTGFKGRALSVVLPKTTLTCESFAEGTAATLNAEECVSIYLFEPVHDKTNNLGFRPGPTQTGLYKHRRWLEA